MTPMTPLHSSGSSVEKAIGAWENLMERGGPSENATQATLRGVKLLQVLVCCGIAAVMPQLMALLHPSIAPARPCIMTQTNPCNAAPQEACQPPYVPMFRRIGQRPGGVC